jgi:hypothetical protein
MNMVLEIALTVACQGSWSFSRSLAHVNFADTYRYLSDLNTDMSVLVIAIPHYNGAMFRRCLQHIKSVDWPLKTEGAALLYDMIASGFLDWYLSKFYFPGASMRIGVTKREGPRCILPLKPGSKPKSRNFWRTVHLSSLIGTAICLYTMLSSPVSQKLYAPSWIMLPMRLWTYEITIMSVLCLKPSSKMLRKSFRFTGKGQQS